MASFSDQHGMRAAPPTDQDRMGPETGAAWLYHQSDGWKLVDNPLGRNFQAVIAPEAIRQRLEDAGYDADPDAVLGQDVELLLFSHRRVNQTLLVLTLPHGRRHILLANGLPSLLEVLRSLDPLVQGGRRFAPSEDRNQ